MKHDVIIIGGGPGGSALGCYLAKLGISNLILESANHPREHVGESMVTATTRIFQELDLLDAMEKSGAVHKYGASWHSPHGGPSMRVEFSEIDQPGIEQNHTYHVDRSQFDLMLLKQAEKLGSTICQGVNVKAVAFEEDRAVGVHAQVGDSEFFLPAKLVVDASGRRTLLGSQLGIKRSDARFRQFAAHAWFEGVDRGENPDDIHIYFLPVERGWMWQIPISATVTSVGVVVDARYLREGASDRQALFDKMIASSTETARAMQRAAPIKPLKIEADFSYEMDAFVGHGWMLIGDAARFVDPIFSSGVSVAMHSAKFASEVIEGALAAGDFSAQNLRPYEDRMKRGTKIWYEFITLYYKLRLIFTRFINRAEYRTQLVGLLQGEVFDRDEVPVLEAMRDFVHQVETTEGHLLKPYLDGGLNMNTDEKAVSGE